MKPNVSLPNHWSSRCRTAVLTLALALVSSLASAQVIDALFDLRDQLQGVVMKSVKGVGEAMQEGPRPETVRPWTLEDLQRIKERNATLHNLNRDLAQQQQKLLTLDSQILSKLPPNDPRRAGIAAEMKQIGESLPDTRKNAKEYAQKLAEANAAIDQWKKKNDPNYRPPSTAGGGSAVPPTTHDGHTGADGRTGAEGHTSADGHTGADGHTSVDSHTGHDGRGGLDALKGRESALEAEARALGKERAAAVLKYRENPTPENKAAAQALKQRLDGLVGQLNHVRNRVDEMTGKSRGDIHVRTAQQIIENARRKGATTAGEEHHDASGRDIPSSQIRQYDVAPDSQKQKRKGKVASTQNQQKAAGVDIPAAGPPKHHKSKTAAANLQQQSASGTAQSAGTGKRRKTAVGSSQIGQTGPSQVDMASRQSLSQNPNRPQRKRQPKSPNSR